MSKQQKKWLVRTAGVAERGEHRIKSVDGFSFDVTDFFSASFVTLSSGLLRFFLGVFFLLQLSFYEE